MPPKEGWAEYMRVKRMNDPQMRSRLNERTKAYLCTLDGRCAYTAGNLNTRAKNVGARGRLRKNDLMVLMGQKVCACPSCQEEDGLEIDHIVPLCNGGENTLENLCRLCPTHHAQKSGSERSFFAYGSAIPDWVSELIGAKSQQLKLDIA